MLDAPAFALNVDMDRALAVLKGYIAKKHWKGFEAGTIKLVYTPFYVFNYTVYSEETDQKIVTGEQTGRKAINANNAVFNDLLSYILEEETFEMSKEPKHSYNFEVDTPNLAKAEASNVARAKIAAVVQTPLNNTIISGLQLVYLPTWRVWATVGGSRGDTYRLDIDAVLGTVMDEEKVPSREKGTLEITLETLEDLKNPGSWPKYAKTSAEFLSEVMGRATSGFATEAPHENKWLMPFLIVAALLLAALFLYNRFFR